MRNNSSKKQLYFYYRKILKRKLFYKYFSVKNIVFYTEKNKFNQNNKELLISLGLAYRLEKLGYDIRIVPQKKWHILPRNSNTVIGLNEKFDPLFGKDYNNNYLKIAWILNKPDEWLQSKRLPVYNEIFVVSGAIKRRLDSVINNKVYLLRLAVEHDRFENDQAFSGKEINILVFKKKWTNKKINENSNRLNKIINKYKIKLFESWTKNKFKRVYYKMTKKYLQSGKNNQLLSSSKIIINYIDENEKNNTSRNLALYEAFLYKYFVITDDKLYNYPGVKYLFYLNEQNFILKIIEYIYENIDNLTIHTKKGKETVLSYHTWEKRANHFNEIYNHILKKEYNYELIGYYPAYLDNPYQFLFYKNYLNSNYKALPLSKIKYGLTNFSVFHLHWTNAITQAKNDIKRTIQVVEAFKKMIMVGKSRGMKLVWTVHNILPHNLKYPNIELNFRRWLCNNSDKIIIHNRRTVELAQKAGYNLPAKKIKTILHPLYINFYPNYIKKNDAKEILNIDIDKKVFLFFGQLRKYKEIDKILIAAEKLIFHQNIQFLIVGKPLKTEFDITEFEEIPKNVRIIPERVNDDNLQLYFNAADYCLFVNNKVLNSGSLMLALSFGTPVIAVENSAYRDYVNNNNGLLYENNNKLHEAILEGTKKIFTDQERKDVRKQIKSLFDVQKINIL